MSSLSNNKRIIEVWAKKGDIESDDFSKFICYWIAFNCWLYTKTNEVRDRLALNKLYSKRELYNNFQKSVIENESPFTALVNVCPIKNNRTENRKKAVKDIHEFKEVIDVLYEIRCNLFHGSKLDTDKRDMEVIKAATPVLEIIVKDICLKTFD